MHRTANRPGRTNSPRGRNNSFSTRSSGGRRPYNNRGGSGRPHGRGGRGGGGGRKIATFDPSRFINTNPVALTQEVYKSTNTFDTFGLDSRIVNVIKGLGITAPTPIQDQIIPEIMAGHDVIGLAETGTGKTAAFLAPLIHKTISEDQRQTLVLTPTRELAVQIEGELRKLGRGLGMHSTICIGGVGIQGQIHGLRRKNQFIIGTPGRVLDLINRGILKANRVTTVVLDEADRMLDMGFIHDIRLILDATPTDRETLFFSATMTDAAEGLVNDFLRSPKTISVKKKAVTDSIEQDVVPYTHNSKFETLVDLVKSPDFKRVLVFGSMKHSVEKLSRQLSQQGVRAESIHGNKSHGQRQRALSNFKRGNARVLVATDVAARGIHVDDVTHVINYDLPTTFEDYVHRIGRTGRGDKRGKALTFIPSHH